VSRPRLIAQLTSGVDKTLILISAPAGYGKTTLVSCWLHEAKLPTAWLSLDEGDNDTLHFLQYLLTALQNVVPGVRVEMLSVFKDPSSFESLFTPILNAIASCETPFVLVLDDFHMLHAPTVLDMLSFLFEHSPPQMHTVILSRTDPLLPLSRLRARNQLMEIRAEQLRFGSEEIVVFLNEVMGLDLSAEDIATMQVRTEGWIAGLQLAAISMQGCEDIHAFVTAFAGSHLHIIDYLTEEVLKQQSEDVRSFLLQTSILSRLCGPLCEAVAGLDDTTHHKGQLMLEKLESMNLFLIPMDNVRRWYRYHHLFADMLNRHLENQYPTLSTELNLRASRWYEQNGFVPEAINHALLAGNQARAITLMEQNGVLLLIRGEVATILNWIAAVEPHSQTHPWLFIFKAWAYALSGDLDRVDGFLETAERMISSLEPSEEVDLMKGTIAAARAHSANLRGEARMAADFARRALDLLPGNNLVSLSLRAVSTSLLGDATSITGDLEEARKAYLESAQICQAAGDIHLTIVINSNLANILVEQGQLHQAARIYSDTLAMATRPDGQRALIAGRLFIELSLVYYEWNRLENAFLDAQQSLTLCKQWGNMDLQALGYAQLARLEHLHSHSEEAQVAAQAAEQLVNGYDVAPRYSLGVRSALARLSILQGDLEHATHLIQKTGIPIGGIDEDAEIPYLLEPMYLALLRLFISQREYNHAFRLSQVLLRNAEAGDRVGRVIEVLILQALIFQGMKDMPGAFSVLGRALVLARPESFTRVFLDEGEPMLKLLYQAKVNQVAGSYISALLLGKAPDSSKTFPDTQALIEPLTGRELELLKLIEEGRSNQDIADKLVISIPTVKRHISNIYSKLGAKNRTQAVSLGKELKLFD
jgi:LuxR family maltose regulon positive regulatory protein